jgi:ACS family hexuronate transporter-like MFS transporter
MALGPPAGRRRWIVVALLFAAMVLNYIDRQTLGLLKPTISKDTGWSNSDFANVLLAFQGAYAISYFVFGRIIDRVGARIGLAGAFGLWSVAQAGISTAQSLGQFMVGRAFLGLGEAGAFPGAIKAVSTWFPQKERAFANGLFNAGTNIGAIITPLLIPVITLAFGWRAAFLATGIAGLIWLPIWLIFYRTPREDRRLSPEELAWIEQDQTQEVARIPLKRLLGLRQTWVYVLAKLLTDPIWGMYLSWLPDFLGRRYGLDLKTFGLPLVAIYLLSDGGSIGGGWLSSRLLRAGWTVNAARKTTLLICALCVTPMFFASQISSLWGAVAIIGLAAAAHQGFSANLYALPADLLPRGAIGSVVGLGGMLGAMGGMAMSKYTGWTLDHDRGYGPVFAIVGGAYLAALLVIHLLAPRLKPAVLAETAA